MAVGIQVKPETSMQWQGSYTQLFQLPTRLAVPDCFLGPSSETGQSGTNSLDYYCVTIASTELNVNFLPYGVFLHGYSNNFRKAHFKKLWQLLSLYGWQIFASVEWWWVPCCNKQDISEMWGEICTLQLQRLVNLVQRSDQHSSK